jgi:hypothetical protein
MLAAVSPACAGDIDDLKAQIQALQHKVEELEARSHAPVELPQPTRIAALPEGSDVSTVATIGSFPGSLLIPGTNTSVKLGGFAKLDAFYDVTAKGGDIQDATQVPLGGTPGHRRSGYGHMDAKYSKFNIESRTPTDFGPFIVFGEMDFGGTTSDTNVNVNKNGYTPRLRYFYGQWGRFLAGQTNSTFRDISAEYESLDSGYPTGINDTRQAQLRYTHPLWEKAGLLLALENPETDYSTTAGVTQNGTNGGLTLNRAPDFITALNADTDWGHWNLRGVLRDLRINDGSGKKSEVLGWGLGASFAVKTWGADKVIGQAEYGNGIGRYITDAAGQSAILDSNGSLDTRTAWGLNMGYQHWWVDGLRSNLDAGWTHIEGSHLLTTAGGQLYNHDLFSAAANLIWSPIPRIDTGVEYMFSRRVTDSGLQGNQHRVLFSVIARF